MLIQYNLYNLYGRAGDLKLFHVKDPQIDTY